MKRLMVLSLMALMSTSVAACTGGDQSGLNVGVDPNNDPNNATNNTPNNDPNNDPNNGGGRPCGDVLSGETVEEGELGECGDFEGPCDTKGSAPRVDQVCRDGEIVEVEQMISCDRDTEGLVVDEGDFDECGGFDDECDETGTQTRTVTICEDGQTVEQEDAQDCERDTEGTLLEEGEFGECGGFDDACDEAGTQTRTNSVCVDGAPGEGEESQGCERDTDGTVVEEGEFGECEGFESICDETGTQSRTNTVCVDGAEAEAPESQDCERDTDGTLVEEGEPGECGGFENACDETGTQPRLDTVCEEGEQVQRPANQACVRDTDGTVVEEGEFGECGGFDSTCDETGTQNQQVTLCRGGRAIEDVVERECERDTEGTVVAQGEFGECGGFDDTCDEAGTQTRTNTVCRDGAEAQEDEGQDCARDTDGLVVSRGEFGACVGFEGECDEAGTKTRTNLVCEGGQAVEQDESQDCERQTEGLILEAGDFGECGDFEGICSRSGIERRTNLVCRSGAPTEEPESRGCSRETDGIIAEEGEFGRCGGFQNACQENGTEARTNGVCRNGTVRLETETRACTRETDGNIISVENFDECGNFEDECDETGLLGQIVTLCEDGQIIEEQDATDCTRDTDGVVVDEGDFQQCEGFDDECDESGIQRRTRIVCADGQEIGETLTRDCNRDTDGRIVEQGLFGQCGGFDDVCDETGTQTRTDQVCQAGVEVSEDVTQDCTRDTDGVVVSQGQFGDCGGFDEECDETGTQTRTNTVCENAQAVEQDESQSCTRDTDGVVVSVGDFGVCENFDGTCDETGTQSRLQIVCTNGQGIGQDEFQDCTRDTDGVIVSVGDFGVCDNVEEPCSNQGTQVRILVVCEDGGESNEPETQSCSRNPDGDIISAGPFGDCEGFDDDCDETGTQTRDITICVGGAELPDTDTQACTRVPDNCQQGCGDNDDVFEVNQIIDDAALIGRGETDAFLCRQDYNNTLEVDFYAIDLPGGAEVTIELEYDHALVTPLGELFTLLYNADEQLVDFFGRDGNTDIDRPLGGTFTVPLSQEGEWFLQVDGTQQGNDVPYTIRVSVITPTCDFEDIFEVNDTCETATLLPLDLDGCEPGSGGCTCTPEQTCDEPLSCVQGVCQTAFVCGPEGDEDFYAIDVAEDQSLTITIPHFHFGGNLELEVYEPDFQTLAGFSFNAGPNFEEVIVDPTVSGRYCIRVFTRSPLTTNGYSVETLVE